MKILSIDVGIKNLAFCLFSKVDETDEPQIFNKIDKQFKITKWDIIDISEQEDSVNCCFSECNKPAKFEKMSDDYAIEFADWLIKRQTNYFESLKELLEIFKKENGL